MTKKCVLIDAIIYCQCGDPSSHYGTMGERSAREVRCESPPSEQVPSKELFEAWLNTPGPAVSSDNPYTVTLIKHLYEAWCAAWNARTAHEPPDDRPTDEHAARFSSWLAREMPAGTVIGDPNWWARKLLNAAYVYAPDSSAPPPATEPCTVCRRPLPPLSQWSMPACPTCTEAVETAAASLPPGCNQCPHSVGDIYERDCAYPHCSPQPPVPDLKALSDARLDWAMACECTCSACTTFDQAIRSALTKEVR